ncbi:7 transmembrane sweet-taste receptor of 3 GCPR-domain-containing protein [Fimicolochytrium jonesii]|uniref:7 transmembrane sweet-taste receptor of 3 GCPR-domain-containing protein n=1 Tax=Fimicolochytrium jonesii TaxID=1396493 RepID=UPI0022FDEC15|nr:7 transmembrane sweet-taste receptor of 3 GCPR-domain-containing protein [Fimicolochytrium jonesii]KAI8816218.1 7 transmembrane sweet-taste receptor of 3 GCPR-domain-containing protein [Fimicolochytrium jonesii]
MPRLRIPQILFWCWVTYCQAWPLVHGQAARVHRWRVVPPSSDLPTGGRCDVGMLQDIDETGNKDLYLVGGGDATVADGLNSAAVSDVWLYKPSTNVWMKQINSSVLLRYPASAKLGRTIYSWGGYLGDIYTVNLVNALNLDTMTFRPTVSLSSIPKMAFSRGVGIEPSTMLIFGGGAPSSPVWKYNSKIYSINVNDSTSNVGVSATAIDAGLPAASHPAVLRLDNYINGKPGILFLGARKTASALGLDSYDNTAYIIDPNDSFKLYKLNLTPESALPTGETQSILLIEDPKLGRVVYVVGNYLLWRLGAYYNGVPSRLILPPFEDIAAGTPVTWELLQTKNPSFIQRMAAPVLFEAPGHRLRVYGGCGDTLPPITQTMVDLMIDDEGGNATTSRILPPNPGPYTAGSTVTFQLELRDEDSQPLLYGGDKISATHFNTFTSVLGFASVQDHTNGTYTVSFPVEQSGNYTVSLVLNGHAFDIPALRKPIIAISAEAHASTSSLQFADSSGSASSGSSGTSTGSDDQSVAMSVENLSNAKFGISLTDAFLNHLTAAQAAAALSSLSVVIRYVSGPSAGTTLAPDTPTISNSSIFVAFTPTAVGKLSVDVALGGDPLSGSPFAIVVTPDPVTALGEPVSLAVGSKTGIAFVVLTVLGLLVAVVFMGFIWVHRENKIIKAISPVLCMCCLLGTLLLYTSNMWLFGKPSNATCVVQPFWLSIGYSFLITPLLAKLYRLFVIFAGTERTTAVKTNQLTGFALIPSLNILICIIWSAIDAPKPGITNLTSARLWECHSDDSTVGTAALWSLIGFNALCTVAGAFLAYLTRNVYSRFDESKAVGLTVYTTTVVGGMLLAVLYLVPDVAEVQLWLRFLAVWLPTTLATFILFAGRLWSVLTTHATRQQRIANPLSSHTKSGTSPVKGGRRASRKGSGGGAATIMDSRGLTDSEATSQLRRASKGAKRRKNIGAMDAAFGSMQIVWRRIGWFRVWQTGTLYWCPQHNIGIISIEGGKWNSGQRLPRTGTLSTYLVNPASGKTSDSDTGSTVTAIRIKSNDTVIKHDFELLFESDTIANEVLVALTPLYDGHTGFSKSVEEMYPSARNLGPADLPEPIAEEDVSQV